MIVRLPRLEVPVGQLTIRDAVLATVEIVSCSAAAISAAVYDEHSASTYEHHSVLVRTG